MRNIKITIAYDGSNFHGWQLQPGLPTIQGALNDAARKITQEKITVQGASRTDTGVHALGQVAHFKTQSGLSATELQRAINALLPPADSHHGSGRDGPRFSSALAGAGKDLTATEFFRGRVCFSPFEYGTFRVLHYPFPLNEAAMVEAARLFEGEHDFSSFAASSGSEEDDNERTMVRVIHSSELMP